MHHSVALALAKHARLKSPVLYAFDFDGTLVGLQKNAYEVVLPGPMARTLGALAKTGRLAIITGRGLADIQERTKALKLHLAGSHGFEIRLASGKKVSDGLAAWGVANRKWVKATRAAIREHESLHACTVGLKKYSLSVHFDHCENPEVAQLLYARLMRKLTPKPRIIQGHLVVNLVPKGAFNKGDAVRALMKELGCRSAVFIGDDITDEDVFRRKWKNVLSIRVGGDNRRVPANLHFEHRRDVAAFLGALSRSPAQ